MWHLIITTLKMNEMSSDIIRSHGVDGAGTYVKVPRLVGDLQVRSAGPVVIKRLLELNSLRR